MPPNAWLPLGFPLLPQPDQMAAANPAETKNENRVVIANILSPSFLRVSGYEGFCQVCVPSSSS